MTKKKKRFQPKTKKRVTKKAVSKKNERRSSKRIATPNLWGTEFAGDFLFHVKISNLSEGGCFIEGKLKTFESPSTLKISVNGATLELNAQPLHDTVQKKSMGTGYCFLNTSPAQLKTLKSFLRNLN